MVCVNLEDRTWTERIQGSPCRAPCLRKFAFFQPCDPRSSLPYRCGDSTMLELTSPSPRRCDGVSRRGFLQVGTLGLAGLTLADALRARAPRRGVRSRSVGDLDLARWRAATARDLRSQARRACRVSRPAQGDLDRPAGRAGLGVAAQPCATARQDVDHPVDAPRQRRSFRGRALDVDRLSRVQRDEHGAAVSVGRLDRRPDPGPEEAGHAGVCRTAAHPLGGDRAGLSRIGLPGCVV